MTGRFPTTSSSGNKYVFIYHNSNLNIIWGIPIKSRAKQNVVAAYNKCHALIRNTGANPEVHVMDNETSKDLEEAIAISGLTIQLVPPNQHRRNNAERAIQTWKCHFISGLSGTRNTFH